MTDRVRITAEGDAPGDPTEYAHFDADGNLVALEREEDVESVLEWAKARYNEGLADRHCEFRHVGSYPANVLEIFARKNGIPPGQIQSALGKDQELTKRLLNDRDLSGFRTLAGRY